VIRSLQGQEGGGRETAAGPARPIPRGRSDASVRGPLAFDCPQGSSGLSVLYHHRTQGHGAEGVHITGIVEGLRKAGCRVTLVSPPGVDPALTAGAYLYGAKRTPLGRLWKWVSARAPQAVFELLELGYNAVRRAALDGAMERERPDFVYERYAFFLWITAALARRRGLPFVLEVNEVCGIPRARPLVLEGLARRIERYVFSEAALIVTVSSFLKRKVVEAGADPGKVVVLPNGVDASLFAPRPGARAEVRRGLGLEDALVVGFAGWIDPWDNLPFLLEAFRDLAAAEPRLRLLLIGDAAGKGVTRGHVAEAVSRLGLAARVTHLPRVERRDMPAHIDAMDVCVLPHSNPFGSPVVLFEFLAMGKPVVAPAVPPVLDVVVPGENGLTFPPGDRAALRDALARLARDAGLREALGRRARRCVEEAHGWDRKAEIVLGRSRGLTHA
jgi:glycosyltransferase involved in cell wall biosynthesis